MNVSPFMLSIRRAGLALAVFAVAGFTPAAGRAATEAAAPAGQTEATGNLVPAAEKDPAWVAAQRADYPLEVCIVSDEELEGGMGGPVDMVYEQPGKPDTLVRFCCKHCVRDFQKEPQKFLGEIAAARAKKAAKK